MNFVKFCLGLANWNVYNEFSLQFSVTKVQPPKTTPLLSYQDEIVLKSKEDDEEEVFLSKAKRRAQRIQSSDDEDENLLEKSILKVRFFLHNI